MAANIKKPTKQLLKFKIKTVEEERETIQQAKEKEDWYKKNDYPITLPKKDLESEYIKEKYLSEAKRLEKLWSRQDDKFVQVLTDFLNKDMEQPIVVHVGKYGVAGRYTLPNHVYINTQLFDNHIEIIKHEIVHLLLEPFVQKYGIDHEEKENLVDTIQEIVENTPTYRGYLYISPSNQRC